MKPKKPTHTSLKADILRAIEREYETAYAHDRAYQAQKPDILKRIDAKLTRLLKPLFT